MKSAHVYVTYYFQVFTKRMSYRNDYETRSRLQFRRLKIAERSIFNEWMFHWNRIVADVSCRVDGKLYRVHSKLFSFWSPGFETKFQRDFHNVIIIPTIKQSQFEIIVKYMYTTNLKLTPENVLEVLHAADYLEINSVIEACKYYVVSSTKIIDNIFDIYRYLGNKPDSRVFSEMKTGILKSWKYIRCKQDINYLSFHVIKDLVERLSGKWNELIEICLEWVMFDFEGRVGCVSELIRCICGRQVEFDDQQLVEENLGDVFRHAIYTHCKDDRVRFAECLGLTRINGTAFHNDVKPPKSMEIFYYQSWKKRMEILRSDNQYDLTVHVKNKAYFLNTWVLSISSKFFQTALPSSFIEIDLEEDDFETVLNYMYGKNLRITSQNIKGVLRTYYYLKMDSLKTLIINFLKENVTHLSNIFKLFELSMQKNNEIQFLLKNYFLRHFSEISEHENFCHLSKNCFSILLSSRMARLSNEQKFMLCETWIKEDFENRCIYAEELLHCMNCSIKEISQFHAKLNKFYLSAVMNEEVENEAKMNDDKEKKFENFTIPFVMNIPKFDWKSSKKSKKENKFSLQFYNNFCIKMERCDFSNVNFKTR